VADAVTFRLTGGETFMADLRAWRDRLRREVHAAAVNAAGDLAGAVTTAYPVRTGALRRGVRTIDDAPFGDVVLVRVKSLAPHSHLYEAGVPSDRAYVTKRGARHRTGRARPHPTLIPEAIRQRRAFYARVHEILRSPEPAIGSGTPTVTGRL
jgi:hypothetical protein